MHPGTNSCHSLYSNAEAAADTPFVYSAACWITHHQTFQCRNDRPQSHARHCLAPQASIALASRYIIVNGAVKGQVARQLSGQAAAVSYIVLWKTQMTGSGAVHESKSWLTRPTGSRSFTQGYAESPWSLRARLWMDACHSMTSSADYRTSYMPFTGNVLPCRCTVRCTAWSEP